MIRNRLKMILSNEEGSGLVLALMVLLVLSVLGAALGVVTIGSLQLSTVNRDSNSAYYIAEAGANLAYEEFKEIVDDAYKGAYKNIYKDASEQERKTLFFGKIQDSRNTINHGKPYKGFDQQMGEQPVATISIGSPEGSEDKKEYTIQSVGQIGEEERTVEKKVLVNWIAKQETGEFPKIPKAALIIKEDIYLKDKTVKGDIYLDSIGEKTFTIGSGTEGSINNIGKIYAGYEDEALKENIFSFPDYYHKKGNEHLAKKFTGKVERKSEKIDWNSIKTYQDSIIKTYIKKTAELRGNTKDINGTGLDLNSNKAIISLNKDYKQPKLLIQNNHTVDIGDNDILLAVNELNKGWGETKIIGDGSLTFFVSEKAQMTGGPFNMGENKVDVKFVFDSAIKNVEIAGNSRYQSQIIAPYSTVTITDGAQITGDIIAQTVIISGGGEVTGNVTAQSIAIPGGGEVIGNLVGKSIDFSGAGKVIGNVSADRVDISGGGIQVTGSVIAQSIRISGGGVIEYHSFNFNDFDSGTGESDVSIEDLIKPEPVIESD